MGGKKPQNSHSKRVRFADNTYLDPRSEWKLPLRGQITCRHCRQPKLPNFLYWSNTTSWRLTRRAYNNIDPKKIANKFADHCTSPPIRLAGDKSKRQFHQLPLTGTSSFTPAYTKDAIRLSKSSTAIGPDGMSTLHLKKLAQGAINYLTSIFNLSISTGQIPEILHMAIIIPIQKP